MATMPKRRLRPRKLLVASTGVMTVSYLAYGCDDQRYGSSVANLMAEIGHSTAAPPEPSVPPSGTSPNATVAPMPISCVANLPAPPVFTQAPPDGELGPPMPSATDAAVPAQDAGSTANDGGDDGGAVALPRGGRGPVDAAAGLDSSAEGNSGAGGAR
jgi:hypothetical protein